MFDSIETIIFEQSKLLGFICFKVFKYNFSGRILSNYITLALYKYKGENNSYFPPFCQKMVQFSSFLS